MDASGYFRGKKITLMGLAVFGNPRFSNELRPAFLHGELPFPDPLPGRAYKLLGI